MQRYTIFFIAVNAVHVSGRFSTHHQELKTVHTASGMSSLLRIGAQEAEGLEFLCVCMVDCLDSFFDWSVSGVCVRLLDCPCIIFLSVG
jgi:hypothetical protein